MDDENPTVVVYRFLPWGEPMSIQYATLEAITNGCWGDPLHTTAKRVPAEDVINGVWQEGCVEP